MCIKKKKKKWRFKKLGHSSIEIERKNYKILTKVWKLCKKIKEHTEEEGLSFFFFLNAILLDFVLGLGDGEICCTISPLPSFDLKSEKKEDRY